MIQRALPREKVRQGLLGGAAIGYLCKHNATLSGAEGGCQSEIGVASATTILGMTWGVRFLQEGRGREYEAAVKLAATVPIGWMIGCPLLGFISDRLGRRKPVIFAGTIMLLGVVTWVLFGNRQILRGHTVGMIWNATCGNT